MGADKRNRGNVKPENVNILGLNYKIEYVDKPSDVDIYKRESLWGQIDFWTRTIRVYQTDRTIESTWSTIFHEVLHGISSQLNLCLNKDEYHDDLDVLAFALYDSFTRNGWMKVDDD